MDVGSGCLDWKAAMLNDRYFDLAVGANFLVTNEADEEAYLHGYFGQPADEYQRARFLLMRQVLHMFAATVFLLLGSAGKPVDESKDLPSFTDFHQRMWLGEVDLNEAEMKILYGRVHWRQLLKNLRQPQFEEAGGPIKCLNHRPGALFSNNTHLLPLRVRPGLNTHADTVGRRV